jgi:hypothetical protein
MEKSNENITKPSDCVFCFGIPTTRKDIAKELEDKPANKSFYKQFDIVSGFWTQVGSEVEEFKKFAADKKIRLNIVEKLTLKKFTTQLSHPNNKVIILFTHWDKKESPIKEDAKDVWQVEFFDGFYSVNEVVEAVPEVFSGILDLCVCKPRELILELRKKRPECIRRWSKVHSTPFIWLMFYKALFANLVKKNCFYLDALDKTFDEFEKIFQSKINKTKS